jgi:hypothetical protein
LGVVAILMLMLALSTATYLLTSAWHRRAASLQAATIQTPNSPTSAAPAAPRDATVRSSSTVSSDDWTQLFNGRNLTGWKAIPPQHWRVENGVIHGSGPDAFLLSESSDFEDFHLRVEFRINQQGDSGVHFRLPAPTPHRASRWGYTFLGPEAEIGIRKSSAYRTGALTVKDPGPRVLAPAPPAVHAAGEWATLEVIAQQQRIQTLVNGKPINDYFDAEHKFRRGHIALASWEDDQIKTQVEFRRVEIKRLATPQ